MNNKNDEFREGRLRGRNHVSYSWLCALVMLAILLLPMARPAVAEYNDIEVRLTSDPLFSEFNDPINLANATQSDTVPGEWQRDFGEDIPNGTYYGTFFSPSLFHHNLEPVWIDGRAHPDHPEHSSGTLTSYIMLSNHFNLSYQKLMAGSSEWWMRLPVTPGSIEASFGVLVAIFEGATNASQVGFEDDYYSLAVQGIHPDYPGYLDIRPEWGGYCPDEIVRIRMPGSRGSPIEAGSGINYLVTSEHVYIKANAVLEPGTDYVLSVIFRMPESGGLKTYWSTAESPSGRYSVVTIADIYHSSTLGNGTKYYTGVQSAMTVALDLDNSFVFLEGVGMGGLFGVKLNLGAGSRLVVRPFFNTSRNGSQFMSFMLPFISNETAWVHPRIFNGWIPFIFIGPLPSGYETWNFSNGFTYFYPMNPLNFSLKQVWDYHDFVLFSSNVTLNWSSFDDDDRWNVAVEFYFNRSINLTLLSYVEDRPRVKWAELDGMNWTNSSKNPYFVNDVYDFPSDSWTHLNYKIYCSARGTDGQWAVATGTSGNLQTYSHHFPTFVHLSSAQWKLVNESGGGQEFETYWDLAEYHWNTWSVGHRLKAIYYAIKHIIATIWDGGGFVVGKIYDGLSWVWEGMKKFGSWVYTALVEFIGTIYNFFESAYDTLVSFWGSFQYVVAPLIMMSIVGVAGKLSMGILKGRGDT